MIKKPRENEEAKARYRALKIQPRWVVTPRKQTTNKLRPNVSDKHEAFSRQDWFWWFYVVQVSYRRLILQTLIPSHKLHSVE